MRRAYSLIAGTSAAVLMSPLAGCSEADPYAAEREAVATRVGSCAIVDSVTTRPDRAWPFDTLVDLSVQITQSEEGREAVKKYWSDDTIQWVAPTIKATGVNLTPFTSVYGERETEDPHDAATSKHPLTLMISGEQTNGATIAVRVESRVYGSVDGPNMYITGVRECGSITLSGGTDSTAPTWQAKPHTGNEPFTLTYTRQARA